MMKKTISSQDGFMASGYANQIKKVILAPLACLFIFAILHFLYVNYGSYFPPVVTSRVILVEGYCYSLVMTLLGYWLLARLINKGARLLVNTQLFASYSILSIVLPIFSAMIKTVCFLAFFNLLVHQLDLPDDMSYVLNKVTSILIICGISWLLFKLADVVEQLVVHKYQKDYQDIAKRKIYTQTTILKRVAYSATTIITVGAVLMLFDNVRALGASVLTTAGVLGLVITFTAQRSLASIFSGLEIALTQPIKIGDSVVIDNEKGTIEEINFRAVVIKLADWRRLVVPTSYFLEKSFQNWSRQENNNLIGSIYLYADFTLPLNEIRKELKNILKSSTFWDANVGDICVNELKESVMQLKVRASARNPSDVGNLQNEIREKLIHYITQNHPTSLPLTRSCAVKNNAFDSYEERSLQEVSFD